MTKELISKHIASQPLILIGLLLTGLFSGILITLVLTRSGPESFVRPEIVERVELGRSHPLPVSPASTTPDDAYLNALSLNAAFKMVAASVTPSVVFIQVESMQSGSGLFHQFNGRNERRIPSRSVGSGVLISEQGFVVTNNHVIENADQILVTLEDKREYGATLVGSDVDTDLAVLKLDNGSTRLPSIPLGNQEELAVGEWVLAVGNPFRLTSTITAGIVSALGRQVDVIDNEFGIENFIQTDAAINPGNSGGALVNMKGELVGIATAIATETGSYEGYGFAVPVSLVERVVTDLIKYGEVHRGYLGVQIWPVDAQRARDAGLPSITGVYLVDVRVGLAGYNGGLRSGDVLLSISGRTVSEPNQLQTLIAVHGPGDAVTVEVWRNRELKNFTVVLEGREDPMYQSWVADLESERTGPPTIPSPPIDPGIEIVNVPGWGVGLSGLDGRLRKLFGAVHGAYMAYIENDSPFASAGVPRNMLLIEVDERSIMSVDDAVEALGSAMKDQRDVLIRVHRSDGTSLFFELQVPDGSGS